MRPFILALTFLSGSLLSAGCYKPDIASPGFFCHPEDSPACPDGQTCVGTGITARCVTLGAVSVIPKSSNYSGLQLDPGLDGSDKCPDAPLEPNDTIATAIPSVSETLKLTKDGPVGGLMNQSICPTGDNPKGDGHDVDYFQITTSESLTVKVEIFYDVKYGDLDVGIFRPDGTIVQADGSAMSNGCVAASTPAGVYYIGVAGANNKDSNRYMMQIRYTSAAVTCSGAITPVDMGS